MRKSKVAEKNPNMLIEIVKAALIASLLSILLIVVAALLLKIQLLPSGGNISLITAIIKVISAAVASLLVMRKCASKRWLFGGIAGLAHAVLACLVFAVFTDSYSFSIALLSDLGIGLLSGMLTAVVIQALK